MKKSIPGGFGDSPLFLNKSVRENETWSETAINKRANILAKKACEIWSRPSIDSQRLELYVEPGEAKEQSVYSLEHYDHLQGDMLDLYKALEKRVLNLDSSVRVEFKKLYVAFKAQTNFVDIVPQKKRLRLSLNTDFDKIKDPKGICKDVSGLGRWGNGDVEVGLGSILELDYVMDLIEQAFDEQVENI